ncbi:MAG: hypothetical protein ABEN55_03300 [Bradymonadaceae bacterium]
MTLGAVALALSVHILSPTAILLSLAALFVPYALVVAGLPESDLSLGWLVLAAVAARIAFLPADPMLSDDIFRYVWDGRITLAGINPFAYPPDAQALAPLRDPDLWPKINHPEVPTIYPPGAQYLFALNALIGGGVLGIKTLFILIEAACVAGCGWWLTRTARSNDLDIAPLRAFATYALNPLVIVVVAWSGHLDVVAWGLLAVGLVVWRFGTTLRSALGATVAIGASIAVKFLGLAALPLLAVDRDGRGRDLAVGPRIALLAVAPVIVIATYLPFLGAGADLFSGFGTYAEKWRGNDGAYRAVWSTSYFSLDAHAPKRPRTDDGEALFRLEALDGPYRRLGWTKEWKGETIPATTYTAGELAAIVGKATAVFVVGLALLWCLLTGAPVLAGLLWLLLALYFFAPIVHPWYVAWLIPLAALSSSTPGVKAALVFSFTSLAAYLAWVSSVGGGPWHVPDWAVAVEYGVVALVAFWEIVFAARRI